MPDKSFVRFALIDNDYLDAEEIFVRQVLIEVPLPQPVDPLTHQLIRDEPAVREVVRRAKEQMNQLVSDRIHEARVNTARLSQKQKKQQGKARIKSRVSSSLEGGIRKALELLNPEVQRAVKAAYKKHQKAKTDYESSVVRWRVNVVFSSAGLLLKWLTLSTGSPVAVASLFNDLRKVAMDVWELSKSEAALRNELTGMFEQILRQQGAVQAPSRGWLGSAYQAVTGTVSSLWWSTLSADWVRTKIQTYDERLSSLEYGAKSLSSELEGVLNKLERSPVSDDATQEVVSLIERITSDVERVADGRRFSARCLKALREAEQKGAFKGGALIEFLLPYAWQWSMVGTVWYFGQETRSFEFLAEQLKKDVLKSLPKSGEDLRWEALKKLEEFVNEHMRTVRITKMKGVPISAADLWETAKFAAFPPEDKKALGALAASLLKGAIDKSEEAGFRFESPLFGAVVEGVKGLAEQVSETLGEDDEDGE